MLDTVLDILRIPLDHQYRYTLHTSNGELYRVDDSRVVRRALQAFTQSTTSIGSRAVRRRTRSTLKRQPHIYERAVCWWNAGAMFGWLHCTRAVWTVCRCVASSERHLVHSMRFTAARIPTIAQRKPFSILVCVCDPRSQLARSLYLHSAKSSLCVMCQSENTHTILQKIHCCHFATCNEPA